jgi:hypothetical protein
MIDDILAGLFGEVVFGRLSRSRRAQLLFRLFFGVLGTVLGVLGAAHVGLDDRYGAGTALRATAAAMFLFLAAFFLFNVALGRAWRWPGRMFVLSLVGLFVVRIGFGR